MNTTEKADWERWFEKHRGTDLAMVVFQIARVALAKGTVTAEDTHCIPVTNPNVRGAAMRAARRLGIIRKKSFTYGTTKASKGHAMMRWELVSAVNARNLLNAASRTVVRDTPVSPKKFSFACNGEEKEPAQGIFSFA